MSFNGKLIVFSAPSGSGKTTIVKSLMARHSNLFGFSISATNRHKRDNEIDGKDYYFISKEEFEVKIKNNDFIEWEEVYQGTFYGTLKSEIQRIHGLNQHILFDIDVIGGLNIKKLYPNNTLSVFVMPPSAKVLEERLKARQSETAEMLKKRMDKAIYELSKANLFDKIIINDDLQKAIDDAEKEIFQYLTT